MTPPCRWSLPVRKLGSTFVVSTPSTNMRSPFLATERGIATATTTTFRQDDRNSKCATTVVVTSNIMLERMLLHSGATSMVNPGICTSMPRCSIGIPAAAKSKWADAAEPCCRRVTIGFKRDWGSGTIQSRKQRGKSARRKALVPKKKIKAPIHHARSANMFSESCTSAEEGPFHLNRTLAHTAMTSSAEPTVALRREGPAGDFHSRMIKAALRGGMSRMWV